LVLDSCSSPAPDRVEANVLLEPGSPWFEGHFPGNPIFPGLGLLALVEEALRRGLELPRTGWTLEKCKRVRFRKALRPGARLELKIACTRSGETLQAEFQLKEGQDDVGRGVLVMIPGALTLPEKSG
jgi:3-hydroxyacyl-[acyl-carrier-protein] dehydratase